MENSVINYDELQNAAYSNCRNSVIEARKKVYASVNQAMVIAYWKIGKIIYEACGSNERAAYGERLLSDISKKLTKEFGKGFTERNLRLMRQFFVTYQNGTQCVPN